MKNESNLGQLLWLYVDVALDRPVSRFAQGRGYRDYGGADAVATDYQIVHAIEAGYFGPIARMQLLTQA